MLEYLGNEPEEAHEGVEHFDFVLLQKAGIWRRGRLNLSDSDYFGIMFISTSMANQTIHL